MDKIKVGIVGYGNIGKGVEKAMNQNPDFDLKIVFTRRKLSDIKTITGVQTTSISNILDWKSELDVLVLCGGSATDLPVQGPELLRHFNTVDSYDTHSKIPEYYAKMHQSGIEGNNLGLISTGWDPGLFSMMRLLFEAVLPESHTETFWGPGVSQGHSDAIRRIPGVLGAVQYTIPKSEAIQAVQNGKKDLSTRDKHLRECYVAIGEGVNQAEVETAIKTMPSYFADYDTIVNFVSLEELKEKHNTMPHGGTVLTSGTTGERSTQLMRFILELESNPEFTANVITAYARAVVRMRKEGKIGAATVYDIPLSYLSKEDDYSLRKRLL